MTKQNDPEAAFETVAAWMRAAERATEGRWYMSADDVGSILKEVDGGYTKIAEVFRDHDVAFIVLSRSAPAAVRELLAAYREAMEGLLNEDGTLRVYLQWRGDSEKVCCQWCDTELPHHTATCPVPKAEALLARKEAL